MTPSNELIFEILTPLGITVRCSRAYWEFITTIKHPVMHGQEAAVKQTLLAPTEVRVSRSDATVYLFYGEEVSQRWVCAVANRLNGEGFLITAYPTDAIKEGEQIWTK